jgi:hypothetical protein
MLKQKIPQAYLGDGVYLTGDGFHLILSTGSHKPEEWDNVVYLDDSVAKNLLNQLKLIHGDNT